MVCYNLRQETNLMSRQELHDLLVELEQKRGELDPVSSEQNHRLDELIESLEQQKLYPDDFDQYTALATKLKEMMLEYETGHPTFAAVLKSISQVLNNFKA